MPCSPEDDMARTDDDPRELVARLAQDEERQGAWSRLLEVGPSAKDAVLEGLGHANWQVRRLCLIWFDHFADPESLEAMLPLLHDPKSKVRLFAVHSISCDRCKSGKNPINVVPLLIDRIRNDESIRVRRHAVIMLAHQHAHPDLEGFFRDLYETETDARLRRWAGYGIMMCRQKAETTMVKA
jgi:HEAT repeat protein